MFALLGDVESHRARRPHSRGQNGKLVYESDEGAPPNPADPWSYYEIYTINPDGTGQAATHQQLELRRRRRLVS